MSKHVKVKPCPFCGSGNVEVYRSWLECKGCAAEGPVPNAEADDPITAWNRRAPSPALAAMVEACQDLWCAFSDTDDPVLAAITGKARAALALARGER